MAFGYPGGSSGITVNGHDLSEFSCKLQSNYTMGACALETDLFQGKNRSTLLLLDQTYGAMEIVLPLEFWGESRADTVEKWSAFCRAVTGKVILDLGDGFRYACAVKDLGSPAFITDGWLAADVTLLGLRQREPVTISTATELGTSITCGSTFPRTDCVIRLPGKLLSGASSVTVVLGSHFWQMSGSFSSGKDLVLDGVNKIYLLGGSNVTAGMTWEDFPYLVPGENPIRIQVGSTAVTRGVEITYTPTFL